jgi:hypothetical protein
MYYFGAHLIPSAGHKQRLCNMTRLRLGSFALELQSRGVPTAIQLYQRLLAICYLRAHLICMVGTQRRSRNPLTPAGLRFANFKVGNGFCLDGILLQQQFIGAQLNQSDNWYRGG